MSEPRVVVTDHAVVRLCERAFAIDVSAYRWPTKSGRQANDADVLSRMRNAGIPVDRYREMIAIETAPMVAARAAGGWLECGLWAVLDGACVVSLWPTKRGLGQMHRYERGEARRSA